MSQSSKVQVMIVEDSRVVREFLEHVIGRDPRLEVVSSVRSGEEALRALRHVSPDVISMDIRLPGMNGFETTERIMAEKPTPIVVVSGTVHSSERGTAMHALRSGALAVVEKPVGSRHADFERMADRLCTRLVSMSQVNVVRQRFPRKHRTPARMPVSIRIPHASPSQTMRPSPGQFRLLGLVASTGGPNALDRVLNSLSPAFPLPIALVQHITASFHESFVQWLDDTCPLRVVAAKPGLVPRPGVVYVAPADAHLRVTADGFRVQRGEPVCSHRPSGTVLFESMAESLGSQALGVLLTGMGEDGAAGLRQIREAGGHTIAEHESTATVYGMPGAAVRMNAVCESVPVDEIALRLLELTGASA